MWIISDNGGGYWGAWDGKTIPKGPILTSHQLFSLSLCTDIFWSILISHQPTLIGIKKSSASHSSAEHIRLQAEWKEKQQLLSCPCLCNRGSDGNCHMEDWEDFDSQTGLVLIGLSILAEGQRTSRESGRGW